MRSVVVIVALVSVVGVMGVEVSAQDGRPIIWHRVCDIEPGQNAAAATFARDMIDLVNEKMSTGQTTAFQSITAPFNRMHFLSFQPDLGTWESGTAVLLADADYRAQLQKAQGVLDGNSCADSLSRVVP